MQIMIQVRKYYKKLIHKSMAEFASDFEEKNSGKAK